MKALIGIGAVLIALAVGAFGLATLPKDQPIGSYGTPLNGRTRSQKHNSLLALNRLRGARIKPGGIFSFNKRVGTFSQDQGYRKAPVSYNGQLISDWGGGVCQTSTTLYNAALLAGMEIVERHRHRFAPSYVGPGRDAAVAFSNIDLKFRNPYPYPVHIEGEIRGDVLTLSIEGPHEALVKPEIVSKVRHEQDYQTFLIGDPSRGEAHLRNSGKEGCEVAVYRIIGDHRELISTDTYPAMNRVVQYR